MSYLLSWFNCITLVLSLSTTFLKFFYFFFILLITSFRLSWYNSNTNYISLSTIFFQTYSLGWAEASIRLCFKAKKNFLTLFPSVSLQHLFAIINIEPPMMITLIRRFLLVLPHHSNLLYGLSIPYKHDYFATSMRHRHRPIYCFG